ncbi:hypothetical protein ACXKTX_09455 [Burkholderia gladioli]
MTDPNTTALTVQQRAALKWAIEVAHGHSVKEFVEPLRALLTSPRAAVPAPEGWKLVPIERSYDMRVKALLAFNTTEKETNDRDDALDAAHRAMLDAAAAAPVTEPMLKAPEGENPMADGQNTVESGLKRLRAAYCKQQPAPIPDQMALVWRADVMRLALDYGRLATLVKKHIPDAHIAAPSAAQAVAADGAATDDIHEAFGVIKAAIEHGNPTARAIASSLFVCAEKQRTSATTVMARAAVSPATAEPRCADCPPAGYPTDRTRCTPCDRRQDVPATADERAGLVRDVFKRHAPVWLNKYPDVCSQIADELFAGASQAAAPAEARDVVATFDDGLKVRLDSWTGGRHEAGSFGEITLRFTDERHTTVREYRAKDIAPAEPREPVATFDDGLKVYLDSWTAGRHEAGSFGEVTLRFTDERYTSIREYRAKDITPADAREPAIEKYLWELVDEARRWESAYRDSSRRYETLDPEKNSVERTIRFIVSLFPTMVRPAIEYRYTGGTAWCDLGSAETMRADFDGVYRLKAGEFPAWNGDVPADAGEAVSPTGSLVPTERGIYAWVAEGSSALVLVHTRPTAHSPGGVMNASLLRSCEFYNGCPVDQWSGGTWYGPFKHVDAQGAQDGKGGDRG